MPSGLAQSKQDKLVLTCIVSLIHALGSGRWGLGHDRMEDGLLPVGNVCLAAM